MVVRRLSACIEMKWNGSRLGSYINTVLLSNILYTAVPRNMNPDCVISIARECLIGHAHSRFQQHYPLDFPTS